MKKTPKKSTATMPGKFLKLFQLIAILKAGRWTIKQLTERFDISKSSLYRYMEMLEEVGFHVDKDFHDRYFILASDDDASRPMFSKAELELIRASLAGDENDSLRSSVLQKLSAQSEFADMPGLFLKTHLAHLAEQLNHALASKHQVILKRYHSASSNEIRDRRVEIVYFDNTYKSFEALDTEDKVCKQFKLDRIGEVAETHTPYAYEHLHKERTFDMFGIGGSYTIMVTLRLSLRAFLLMREEYPLTVPCLKSDGDSFVFHGPVAGFGGIGRFVMGLISEVKVESPPEFKKYLVDKMHSPYYELVAEWGADGR